MIPKRRLGRLEVDYPKEQFTEGWGLYFEEGWEIHDIFALTIIAVLPSLIFLILWSVYKLDVSAASGVASYIVSVIVLFSGLVVTGAGTT